MLINFQLNRFIFNFEKLFTYYYYLILQMKIYIDIYINV